MKKNHFLMSFILIVMAMLLIMGGPEKARAEIQLTDCFSVTGFLRTEVAVHIGGRSPDKVAIGLDENPDLNFMRAYFVTDWTYKPSDRFKLFSRVRMQGDFTEDLDSELGDYDAWPLDVPDYDWTMMKVSDDVWRAEIWELYADFEVEKLWLRVGKQQIVWGEMIATRIMDIINPLDYSRNFLFEPEEFENIRIPNWSVRARYAFGRLGWINDAMAEGFFNPGDVYPTQHADPESPLALVAFPPFMRVDHEEHRGENEYGVRVGGMLGGFYFTLNYLSVFSDDFALTFRGIAPDPVNGIPLFAPHDFTLYSLLFDAEYQPLDVYGISTNYFIAPANTVFTFEGTWTPNQPYQDAAAAAAGGAAIRDQGTFTYAIRLDRQTFVFPRPTSAAMIQVQFNQTIREGNEDRIVLGDGSRINHTNEQIALVMDQMFHYNDYRVTLLGVWDFDGGAYFKPSFRYTYGDKWFFDLYGIFLGGSDTRPGEFGSADYLQEIVGRVTFQF